MTERELQNTLSKMLQPSCAGKEPGTFAIANTLASFLYPIFWTEDPSYIEKTCQRFGYENITQLREDSLALICSLRTSLTPAQWSTFFGSVEEKIDELLAKEE